MGRLLRLALGLALLLGPAACTQDLSEFREYAYGGQWIQVSIDGEPVPGKDREIYYFKNYGDLAAQLPLTDSVGNRDDLCFDQASFYDISEYTWSLYAAYLTFGFYQDWEIIRFKPEQLRVRQTARMINNIADTTHFHKEHLFEALDAKSSLKDSLFQGTWEVVQQDGLFYEGEPFRLTFDPEGNYSLLFPGAAPAPAEGETSPNYTDSFVIYDWFLRLHFPAGSLWNPSEFTQLGSWRISFTTEEDRKVMHWESLDALPSYLFVLQ